MAHRNLEVTHYELEAVRFPVDGEVREAVRITVFGPMFPQRALEPEILAGGAAARNVTVAPDQRSLRGIFLVPPEEGARVVVRYGDSQEGSLKQPISRKAIRPLSRHCEED